MARKFLFILLVVPLLAQGQRPTSDRINIYTDASRLLPEYYQQNRFDSIHTFLHHWNSIYQKNGIFEPHPQGYFDEELGGFYDPVLFTLQFLLSLQERTFHTENLPCRFIGPVLVRYAKKLYEAQHESGFKYEWTVSKYHTVDIGKYGKPVFLLIVRWADSLLRERKDLDSAETYLCRVCAGQIRHPRRYLNENRIPEIDSVQWRCYQYMRKELDRRAIEFTTGYWVPSSHMQVLGNHPSFGLQLGGGNRGHEIDFTGCIRVGDHTPGPYYVKREDSLYESHAYFGAHIGLDYTRYIFHRLRYEVGIVTGGGYDFFNNSIKDTSTSPNDLNPQLIGSFDWASGLRFNYFFRPRWHLGLEVKYHVIHYADPGGTSFAGGAFSLDVNVGFN